MLWWVKWLGQNASEVLHVLICVQVHWHSAEQWGGENSSPQTGQKGTSSNSTLALSITCVLFVLAESHLIPVQMITVNAQLFPSSLTNSLIAVGNDGLQERDRMVRSCIAIICELGELVVSRLSRQASLLLLLTLWHASYLKSCCSLRWCAVCKCLP